ncbi:MAG: hypothetical protein SGILL_008442 [Bacillariaceae sp.]
MARKFRGHLIRKGPKLIDHIVNLGNHFSGSNAFRKLSEEERIPDVASRLRGAHHRLMKQKQEEKAFIRMLEATEIDRCDFQDDNVSLENCEHDPCTKDYLDDPYTPFSPAYGGSFGYIPALALLPRPTYWTGDPTDRTDTDGYALNFVLKAAAEIATTISSAVCDAVDDDIEVSNVGYQFSTLIFDDTDRVLPLCTLSDECDEDKVAPVIDIDIALERCSGFFDDLASAEACVRESVTASDDCYGVDLGFVATGDCDSAQIEVTATEVTCGKSTTAIVPVFVDGTDPEPSCSFGDETMKITGPRIPRDVGFVYGATDNCGKPTTVNVDVYASEIEDFNAQEMALFFQNGNPDDAAELYLAAHSCSTVNNGQCIKDPVAQDARLYTAIVTASDIAGNSKEVECQIKVIPKGNLKKKELDTTDSTQRFHLTSYSSVFAGATA